VAWQVVCSRKRDGGFNIINPLEVVVALMSKWVVGACELGNSNFKMMIRHRLSSYQSYAHGKWNMSLEWFSQHNHKAAAGSKIWNRVSRAWKLLVSEVKKVDPWSYG
jgi:hypothetical protein